MGWFRRDPSGSHDLAELSTAKLRELVEHYREMVNEPPKSKFDWKCHRKGYVQALRKYEYELRRRPDYTGD